MIWNLVKELNTTKKRICAGIDYSMASPAICVHLGDEWDINNCEFFYLTSRKKLQDKFGRYLNGEGVWISGDPLPDYINQEDRFDQISHWAINCLSEDYQDPEVFLESYSYSSTGMVFSIGENTGILKHKLWTLGLNYEIIAPTVIKKYATGKGNANKEIIEHTFISETSVDFRSLLGQSDKPSPYINCPNEVVDYIHEWTKRNDNATGRN